MNVGASNKGTYIQKQNRVRQPEMHVRAMGDGRTCIGR